MGDTLSHPHYLERRGCMLLHQKKPGLLWATTGSPVKCPFDSLHYLSATLGKSNSAYTPLHRSKRRVETSI